MQLQGIHTVDSSQGLDAKGKCLLSVGRPLGIGFLSDIRRLNVGLTRGQLTIIVANSAVVKTKHPVGCVFRALRKISQNTQAYVLFDSKEPEKSLDAVLLHVAKTIGTTMNVSAAESVSHSLAETDPETQLPMKEAIKDYMKGCFTCYNEETIKDADEMEQPEPPDQGSDNDSETEPVPSAGAAKLTVSSTQLPPPINPRIGEWGVVELKNILNFCSKHEIDHEAWPGNEIAARNRIISTLAKDFQWSYNQLQWFFSSVNMLWELAFGAKPRRDQNELGHWLSRKTKIVGMLPLRLFSGMQRDTVRTSGKADTSSVLWVATKELFTVREAKRHAYGSNVPDDYEKSKKPLLLEVHAEGSPTECLAFLRSGNKFEWLAKVPDTFREASIELWATPQ